MKKIILLLLISLPFMMQAQTEGTLLGTWVSPDNPPPSSAHINTYNEVWGYATADKEYAIIGSTLGTHFVDVTDPANPVEAFFVAGAAAGTSIIHRDYHDHNGYLYAVCDEDQTPIQSTLQIINLNNLPASIEVVYDSNELIRRAHNIFIDAETDRMYALATTNNSQGFDPMRIFDISNPTAPSLLGGYNTFGGNPIGHVHDAFVKNNLAYLNCGYQGLYVVDFTDISAPVTLGSMTDYLQSGYNHSGWPSEDGSYYYFADENHGKDVKAVDVSDFSDMSVNTFFNANSPVASTSIPHNQVVAGDYLYISYYFDGIQVYDISDPANPQRVLFYDTSSEVSTGSTYRGAWGVYPFLPSGNILVSDMQEGLFIIESLTPVMSSVENIEENILLSVSPNPAKEQLNIQINTDISHKDAQVQLLDVMGRELWSTQTDLLQGQNEMIINEIKSFSPGYYVLKVSGKDWQLNERVIIYE